METMEQKNRTIVRIKIFETEDEFVKWQNENLDYFGYSIRERFISIQILPTSVIGRNETNENKTDYKYNTTDQFKAEISISIIVQYWEFDEETTKRAAKEVKEVTQK